MFRECRIPRPCFLITKTAISHQAQLELHPARWVFIGFEHKIFYPIHDNGVFCFVYVLVVFVDKPAIWGGGCGCVLSCFCFLFVCVGVCGLCVCGVVCCG